jgi:hypothetical protein
MPKHEHNGARLVIWIDHREARLFDLDGAGGARMHAISSDAEETPRSFGHVGNLPPHQGYAGDTEKHATAKRRQQLDHFYEEVAGEAARRAGDGEVVVIGPGMARKEFEKSIESTHSLRGRIARNESADANLTDAQLKARAKELLGRPPARVRTT